MSFTTITNGEGDAMRQLERKEAAPAAKTPAKTTKAAKAETGSKATKGGEAQLLLANGEMSEAARIGLSLIGGGVTALTLGMLEGLARKDKAKWWRDLAPAKRGLVLSVFALAAGLIARHRRNNGHHKSANALEAAGIGAWTIAVIYFTEAGLDDADEVAGLANGGKDGVGVDRLKALDARIDEDIRDAAQRLRELAEEERAAANASRRADDDSDRELGLLAFHGEQAVEDDEDDDEDLF